MRNLYYTAMAMARGRRLLQRAVGALSEPAQYSHLRSEHGIEPVLAASLNLCTSMPYGALSFSTSGTSTSSPVARTANTGDQLGTGRLIGYALSDVSRGVACASTLLACSEPTFMRAAASTSNSFANARRHFSDEALRQSAISRLHAQEERRKKAERDQQRAAARHSAAVPEVVDQHASGTEVATTSNLPTVQPVEGLADSIQLSRVLDHPALIITRPIEWGTVILGYEQANRYTVYDESGQIVALLAEDYSGIGNEIGRQVLKTRRSFTATVLSGDGSQVIMRLRRPAYLINSHMTIEDGAGNVVGEVQQRWNLIKRNYDLYMGKRQFAAISGNFLAWDFELKDASGGTLALIDRNFQGFGKELFTDAGKYCIHFGFHDRQAAANIASTTVRERSGRPNAPPVPPMMTAGPAATASSAGPVSTDLAVIPTITGSQLAVVRSLEIDERMVVLAAAIAIDYDYFSQHSRHGGGMFMPPLFMPLPGGGTESVPPTADVPPPASSGAGDQSDVGGPGAGGAGDGAGVADGDTWFPSEPEPPSQAFPPGDGEWTSWDNKDSSGAGGGEEGGGLLGSIWGLFNDGD